MFVQSYSYNLPFDGSHNVEVALSENQFDTPALKGEFTQKWKVPYDLLTLMPF